MSKLFQPLKIGNVEVTNRIAMAPLTRFRASDDHVPLPIVAEYYAQRASFPGTLLISEATFISQTAGLYANVPGIYNQAQIDGWKKVTDAVHAKKSFIYMQLWALGRAASAKAGQAELPDFKVKSASDIAFEGGDKPEPLTEAEIQEYIKWYAQAAKNAIEAGFDGVEVHGANGYLVDQFLQDVSNKRTDAWGGSIENRARFGVEVSKAVVAAVGAEKVGIRVSPFSAFQGMKMTDPVPQFTYYINELKKLNLAYLHVVEGRIDGNADTPSADSINFIVDAWGKTGRPVLVAGGFKTESAYKLVDEEYKDQDVVVVFGRYFIANPDLVFRIQKRIEFNQYDRDTFYNPKEPRGYTDIPFSKEWLEAQA